MAAYHMNKDYWVSIVLDGSVPADLIWKLLDASFKLTK
ncbi:MmcQ/YjbR family DNA-binding protein [Janthinobacterium sp. RB2R34]